MDPLCYGLCHQRWIHAVLVQLLDLQRQEGRSENSRFRPEERVDQEAGQIILWIRGHILNFHCDEGPCESKILGQWTLRQN